jgi:hypothetical protein
MRIDYLAGVPDLAAKSLESVLLIRAEDKRVLFGFWRGKRLLGIDGRLKPGGKYEMATIELREGGVVSSSTARRLATEAVKLNNTLGDPTDI